MRSYPWRAGEAVQLCAVAEEAEQKAARLHSDYEAAETKHIALFLLTAIVMRRGVTMKLINWSTARRFGHPLATRFLSGYILLSSSP
jgi:hypothetical protein